LEAVALARAEKAVITDLLKPLGQNVLQEATDELLSREGTRFPVTGGPVTVTEGDLTVLTLENPPIGESHPEDIRGQILESGLTGANGLTVDDPLLPPDRGRNSLGQSCFLQGGPKLGSKEAGEGLDVNEEGIAGTPPGVTVSGQTAAGDEVMNVGMVSQVAGPGLQHPQETKLPADKAGIGGQSLQSGRGGLKQ
jgi:hypothetical protein